MALGVLLLQFLFCAVVIGRAGFVLSRSADAIAQATGLTGGWVGLALLATVTSLPELASGISAVAVLQAPNLAVGNALGSCVVNLLFLAIVDMLQRHQPMYASASTAHLLAAAFGVVMLGFVAMSLLMGSGAPAAFQLGFYTPVLLGLYLLALRSVFAHEQARPAAQAEGWQPLRLGDPALRDHWRRFGLAAAAVLAAGSWLPGLGSELAATLGWSRSFVGTVFLSVVTTLPEMAVTLAALRLGALDMAIGNLLGSNLFNLAILAVDDLFYRQRPLLADAAPVHAGTAVTAVMMTGLVMIGLVLRPRGRVLRVASWVSIGLVAAYAINAALLFLGAD